MKKEEFLTYLKRQRKLSDYTIRSYGIDLAQFEQELKRLNDGNEFEGEPDAKLIRIWLMDLADGSISNRSINRKISALRTYFHYIEKQDPSFNNPMTKIVAPKMAKRKPSFLFESDMDKLLNEVVDEEDFVCFRNYLIIEILYATGIRRSELLSIEDKDINLYSNAIKIFGKGKKERIVPFGTKLKEDLIKYIEHKKRLNIKESLLITDKDGKPMSQGKLYTMVHKKLQEYNISEKSPHVFRHTCATHLLNQGAEINNVKNLLGHSSLAATEVYAHTTIEQLKNEYKNSFKSIDKQ